MDSNRYGVNGTGQLTSIKGWLIIGSPGKQTSEWDANRWCACDKMKINDTINTNERYITGIYWWIHFKVVVLYSCSCWSINKLILAFMTLLPILLYHGGAKKIPSMNFPTILVRVNGEDIVDELCLEKDTFNLELQWINVTLQMIFYSVVVALLYPRWIEYTGEFFIEFKKNDGSHVRACRKISRMINQPTSCVIYLPVQAHNSFLVSEILHFLQNGGRTAIFIIHLFDKFHSRVHSTCRELDIVTNWKCLKLIIHRYYPHIIVAGVLSIKATSIIELYIIV